MNESEENLTSEFGPRPEVPLSSISKDDQTRSRTDHHCMLCNKSYSNAYNLTKHQRAVHEHVRHPCSVCSKTFSCASNLKRHVREAQEGTRSEFECNECGKVFYY